jgi:hypothetical protein
MFRNVKAVSYFMSQKLINYNYVVYKTGIVIWINYGGKP